MQQTVEPFIGEAAFGSIQESSPNILRVVKACLAKGLSPEQIIELLAHRTGLPQCRLAYIGCAADYLLRHVTVMTETIQ